MVLLEASLMRFDLAHAAIGLAIGIASLSMLGWVRRGN